MISGRRINLRLFRDEQEVLSYYELYNDMGERTLSDHTEIYPPTIRMTEFRETGYWTADKGALMITTKQDRPVGMISFVRKTDFELGIGYRIQQRDDRQKGYMSEALRLFSAYLFDTVPYITRLTIFTAADNVGSRSLAEKCGYTQEGILRQAYFYRGGICDWVLYSMLREESPRFGDLLEEV